VSTSVAVTSALASEALLETSLILTASPAATGAACVVSSPEVALSSVQVIVLSAPRKADARLYALIPREDRAREDLKDTRVEDNMKRIVR